MKVRRVPARIASVPAVAMLPLIFTRLPHQASHYLLPQVAGESAERISINVAPEHLPSRLGLRFTKEADAN